MLMYTVHYSDGLKFYRIADDRISALKALVRVVKYGCYLTVEKI